MSLKKRLRPTKDPLSNCPAFRDLPGVTVRLTPEAHSLLDDFHKAVDYWAGREIIAQAIFNRGVQALLGDLGSAGTLNFRMVWSPAVGWRLVTKLRGAKRAGPSFRMHREPKARQ